MEESARQPHPSGGQTRPIGRSRWASVGHWEAAADASGAQNSVEATLLAHLEELSAARAEILELASEEADRIRRCAQAAKASMLSAAAEEAEAISDEALVSKAMILEESRVEAEARLREARAEAVRIVGVADTQAEAIRQKAYSVLEEALAAAAGIVERAQDESEAEARAVAERVREELDRATGVRVEAEASRRKMLEAAAEAAQRLRAEAEAAAAAFLEESRVGGQVEAQRARAAVVAATERVLLEAGSRAAVILDAAREEAEGQRRRATEEAATICQRAEAKAAEILEQAVAKAQRLPEASPHRQGEVFEEPTQAQGSNGLTPREEGLSVASPVLSSEVPTSASAEVPTSALAEVPTIEAPPWAPPNSVRRSPAGGRPTIVTPSCVDPPGGPLSVSEEILGVLLVCTGNVCRSPAAAAFLRRRLIDLGIPARVSSAGLEASKRRMNAEMVKVLASRGVQLKRHRSTSLTPELLIKADVVLGMASHHVTAIVRAEPTVWPKTFTLKELVRCGEEIGPRRPDESFGTWLGRVHAGRTATDLRAFSPRNDISDPSGQPASAFEDMGVQITDAVHRLICLIWAGPAAEAGARLVTHGSALSLPRDS